MVGRGIAVLKTGIFVVFNTLGLAAVLAAAWMMPYMLDLLVRIAA